MTDQSDRELLEAAARAAGLEYEWRPGYGNKLRLTAPDAQAIYWQPLDDDGQALRLAVKLRICIEFEYCEDDSPVIYAGQSHERRYWPRLPQYPDSMAATRRAIVRAAAALAKEKEKGNA